MGVCAPKRGHYTPARVATGSRHAENTRLAPTTEGGTVITTPFSKCRVGWGFGGEHWRWATSMAFLDTPTPLQT